MAAPDPGAAGPGVRVEAGTVQVTLEDGTRHELPGQELPRDLADWIDEGRREMYRRLAGDAHGVEFFAQHLPVLVTRREGELFPFNCGSKGVGYLPRPERLAEFTGRFRQAREAARGRPARETVAARLAAATSFYLDRGAQDLRCLGGLEIFEGEAFENLRRHPLASLLFTGHSPRYLSYQLDCAVEVVGEGDPRFEFLRESRTLFEYDGFHIAQPRFRHAYVFWLAAARSKTPHRVAGGPCGGPRRAWDPPAEAALGRVPPPGRDRARGAVEAFAAERGFDRVTAELVAEALRALRLEEG